MTNSEVTAITTPRLDLSDPMGIRAEMARAGLSPTQLSNYWTPDHGDVDPLDDIETKVDVRRFLARLWVACERAERAERGENGREVQP